MELPSVSQCVVCKRGGALVLVQESGRSFALPLPVRSPTRTCCCTAAQGHEHAVYTCWYLRYTRGASITCIGHCPTAAGETSTHLLNHSVRKQDFAMSNASRCLLTCHSRRCYDAFCYMSNLLSELQTPHSAAGLHNGGRGRER